MTASLALNNHPRVAAQTRARVAAVADRMGFTTNSAARRLARSGARSRKLEQVGFMYVTPDEHSWLDPACLAMMHGAEHELSTSGASLTFARIFLGHWEKMLRLVRSDSMDGWLISGAVNDEFVDRLREQGAPFVVIGDHYCTRPIHAVNVDYVGAGRMAAEHLIAAGHRRIGVYAGKRTLAYQKQVLGGFLAGLRAMGIDFDDRLIVDERFADWLRNCGELPSAVFSTEADATYLLRQVDAAQATLAQQLQILACDVARPLLTTGSPPNDNSPRIEWPMEQVGRQGALSLGKVVAEPELSSSDLRLAAMLVGTARGDKAGA